MQVLEAGVSDDAKDVVENQHTNAKPTRGQLLPDRSVAETFITNASIDTPERLLLKDKEGSVQINATYSSMEGNHLRFVRRATSWCTFRIDAPHVGDQDISIRRDLLETKWPSTGIPYDTRGGNAEVATTPFQ